MANSHWYTSLSPHCRTVFPCENVLPIGWLTHRVTMTFPLHTRTLSLLASFTRRVTVSSLCTYPLFAPEEASYTRGERSSFILYLLHLFAYYKPLHNTRKPSYRDSCRGNRWYHLKCIFFDFCVYYAGWFFYQKSVCIRFWNWYLCSWRRKTYDKLCFNDLFKYLYQATHSMFKMSSNVS